MTGQTAALGAGTRAAMGERAVGLVIINGRSAPNAASPDGDPAEWKMTYDRISEPQLATLASAPESERPELKPGSRSRHAPSSPGQPAVAPDRNLGGQLIAEGCSGAERAPGLRAERAVKISGP